MKVTLIEPVMIKNNNFSEKPSWQLTPLTLATLAGITPPYVEAVMGAKGKSTRFVARVYVPDDESSRK